MKEKLSTQHNIPRSIGREIGMSEKELDKFIVMIPDKIHHKEDFYVPTVLYEIKQAKAQGIRVAPEDVLEMRKEGWFRA